MHPLKTLPDLKSFSRQIILFILCLPFCFQIAAQVTFTISHEGESVSIPFTQLPVLDSTNENVSIEQISNTPFNSDKKNIGANFYTQFIVLNNTNSDKQYVLETPKTGIVNCWIKKANDTTWQLLRTGSVLKLSERSLHSNSNGLIIEVLKGEPLTVILQFKSVFSIYKHNAYNLTLQPLSQFEQLDSKRLLWQGLFLGIILVMALYNLIIYFAAKDISYLYFVLSIFGIGLYFSFYYGIGIEYLWPNAPVWDTFCYTLIVPFNGLMRIYFTKTYLHTSELLPRINRLLNALAGICIMGICVGFGFYIFRIDILDKLISIIGILGSVILVMMLISGFVAYYREHYQPAQYFIFANLLLVIGAVLFIFREMGLMPDNFFTRYFVQLGTLIQVVVFALGLASRLNKARLQLANEIVEKEKIALEKEKEKKEIIEKQKEELQVQVQQQTLDLKQQNQQLEDIISKLKLSELKFKQLNQVKDKLFSIISHDLRNPLATMQSTLKLITHHHFKLDEVEKEKLTKEAQASLDNLNELLYNLLQWSRSQMNLLEFKPEEIEIKPILENSSKLLQLNAHMKNIRINVVAENNLFGIADKDMIEFVVRNLLSNAIKFSHRDSDVFLKVTANDTEIKFQVLDSGVGMVKAKIQRLLQLNATDSSRGTEKEKGTGLGLLISKDFIEKNKGVLEIDSEPGKGSTFSFTIPQAHPPQIFH